MHALILGGSGTISTWIVRHLLAMKHTVTVVTRGKRELPAGVEQLVADRHDLSQLSAVLAGRRFDATIDMLCFNPAQAELLTKALPHPGHLIFCSTVCALGFAWATFPVTEDAVPAPTFGYGRDKAAAEGWYSAWAARTGTAFTIVRPSTTFDEGMGVLRQIRWDGSAWLARIRAGKPIVVADGGLAMHQFMHADDGGRGLAMIAGNPAAYGRIYHLVGDTTTWADQARTVMQVLGREVPLIGVPSCKLIGVPDDGIRIDIFGAHGVFADRRLAREIGFAPRIPLREAIQRTVTALDAAKRIQAGDEAWEDALVHRWN